MEEVCLSCLVIGQRARFQMNLNTKMPVLAVGNRLCIQPSLAAGGQLAVGGECGGNEIPKQKLPYLFQIHSRRFSFTTVMRGRIFRHCNNSSCRSAAALFKWNFSSGTPAAGAVGLQDCQDKHRREFLKTGSLRSSRDASSPRKRSTRRDVGATRCSLVNGMDTDVNTSPSSSAPEAADNLQASMGLFPGGFRRAEVRIPGLVLRVMAEGVQDGERCREFLESIVNAAVVGGVTMVILEAGGGGDEQAAAGGAKLYDAACTLKALLRGRAELLVAERVDIAAAAGANGVLLSDQGIPAVVARRMMQSAVAESSSLPLVARSVSSAQSALNATASEGADLLFLDPTEVGDAAAGAFVKAVCELVSIPVFIDALRINGVPEQSPGLELLKSGANGLVLTAIDLEKAANGDAHHYVSALMSAVDLAVQQHKEVEPTNSPDGQVEVSFLQDVTDADGGLPQGAQTIAAPSIEVEEPIEAQAKRIVEEERILLTEMVDLVRDASPEMEEVSLLIDAVKQLDELFLLVIVGEYNSGKSSVINALLGKKFLKEGVLPTTNEIILLRHAGEGGEAQERSERHPDGHFLRFLPADLLKQMNLVDTPGTNVILQRQQRLTEEFVPRADLVLFVLSADRPLTDSEVRFLRYIRQWGKKIIFILNKCDILSNSRQVGEVSKFVSENAQRLLSVEQAQVYPVSAREALHAKLSATLDDGFIDPDLLSKNSLWTTSGFGDLEGFILGFMGGSIDTGAERLRLKLETPLGIGVALLGACERQLVAEALKAEADLKALGSMELQLQRYEESMQNDAVSLCQRTLAVIEGAKGRTNKFIDSTLRLSNVEAVAKYLIGSDRPRSMPVSSHFEGEVLHTAVGDVRKALEEHKAWIASNSEHQLRNYWDFVRSRWPPEGAKDAQGAQSMQEQPSMIQLHNLNKKIEGDNDSLTVLEGFDTKAAMILLEQELKEVVLSTFGGLGAAGLSASVLTSILPTTVEDLIALGICSAGGFVGVWNLPLRRADIKKKVKRVADSLTRQFQEAMQKELQESINMVKAEVEALTRPYHKAAEEEVSRISGLKTELQRINAQLQVLRQKVQNLGT